MTDYGIPDIARDIFDEDKQYLGGFIQEGVHAQHWSLNSTREEIIHYMLTAVSLMAGSTSSIGSTVAFKTVLRATDNITFSDGYGHCSGRVFPIDSDFLYFDNSTSTPVNYILKGEISNISGAGVSWDISDHNKQLTSNHDLVGAEIIFTSGALSGPSSYEITALTGIDTFTVAGSLGSVVAGDTYVIVPRRADTSVGAHTFKLVTWFQDVNFGDDPDLKWTAAPNPLLNEEPEKKRQLRWCVYCDWNGSDDTSQPLTRGFRSQTLVSYVIGSGEDLSDCAIFINPNDTFNVNFNTYANTYIANETFDWYTNTSSEFITDLRSDNGVLGYNNTGVEFTVNVSIKDKEINNVIGVQDKFYFAASTIFSGGTELTDGTRLIKVQLDGSSKNPELVESNVSTLTDQDIPISLVSKNPVSINSVYNLSFTKQVKGFDFVVYESLGTDYLAIQPGEIVLGSNNYYFLDMNPIALGFGSLLISGSYPTSDFINVYVEIPSSGKTLGIMLDTREPDYNGVLDGKYHLIGTLYYNSSGDPVKCVKRGNCIEFEENVLVTVTTTNTLSLPTFVKDSECILQGVSVVSASGASMLIEHKLSSDTILSKTVTIPEGNSRQYINILPNLNGSSNIDLTLTVDSGTTSINLHRLYFNYNSTNNSVLWGT